MTMTVYDHHVFSFLFLRRSCFAAIMASISTVSPHQGPGRGAGGSAARRFGAGDVLVLGVAGGGSLVVDECCGDRTGGFQHRFFLFFLVLSRQHHFKNSDFTGGFNDDRDSCIGFVSNPPFSGDLLE